MTVTPEFKEFKKVQKTNLGSVRFDETNITMKPEYRTIDGVKIRYAEGGKKDGPVVLLLSPLPHSIVCFNPIWEKLGAHFRLIALDLPGFGRSEGGLEFMSFKAQGNFLDKFVKALDLKKIHIVGPDVGMAAALHYAIHYKNDISSLIVGDGPAIAPSINGSIINKMVVSSFWRTVFSIVGSGPFVEGAYRLGCVNYVPNAIEMDDYLASYEGRVGTLTHWFATYPENLDTIDPHLVSLDLPVQLFWGDLDIFLLVDNAHSLHKRMKRSELKVFERCGHFSYQDKSEEFAEMVINWVSGGFQVV
ncbi:MAG: alpha/beta hydrolase [Marinilabiliales bacterium]|nr:MAG: alpha/beta hydrolase [Marinilabiliales bacterium]